VERCEGGPDIRSSSDFEGHDVNTEPMCRNLNLAHFQDGLRKSNIRQNR
jgi:hypothetical protein